MDKTFTERFLEAAKAEGLLETRESALSLREELIAALDETVNQFAANRNPNFIRADITVMEVVDPDTGCVFRRELPMDFEENSNGIKIKGEDYYGKASEIVFFSGGAVTQMTNLTGGGEDEDPSPLPP